jgi:hypothetical protein
LTPPYSDQITGSDPHLALPYTEQWNLSVSESVTSKNVLTISYVGNVGKKLLYTYVYDPSAGDFVNGLNIVTNAASSNYHALQLQDQGDIFHGLKFVGSYSWAHAIDNASGTYFNGFAPQWGNADSDIRQSLNLALNYQVTIESDSFLHRLMTGWVLSNRFTATTGSPLDISQGEYFINNVNVNYRPDLVPGVPIILHNVSGILGGWALNYDAFSAVPVDPNTGAPDREGDLPRNFIHGPNFWNLNTAGQRTFPITEKLRLDFRVEAFNLFNHTNEGGINTNFAAGPTSFGLPGWNGVYSTTATIGVANPLYATGANRSLQLSLKLLF